MKVQWTKEIQLLYQPSHVNKYGTREKLGQIEEETGRLSGRDAIIKRASHLTNTLTQAMLMLSEYYQNAIRQDDRRKKISRRQIRA